MFDHLLYIDLTEVDQLAKQLEEKMQREFNAVALANLEGFKALYVKDLIELTERNATLGALVDNAVEGMRVEHGPEAAGFLMQTCLYILELISLANSKNA